MAIMLDENSVVAHAAARPREVDRSAVLLDTQPLMLEIVERALRKLSGQCFDFGDAAANTSARAPSVIWNAS